ncbi:hypothetical protein RYX56_00835 [Alkalihalophilus lindianensis]|uniref:Uncharacterized protein n=1 Tax=Alkalihalophilus lindianensis TaxID=1630542 RepID=A0ABU3X4V2_9BACI|nr:hypothetical protein [Alkalihalophilus lindianensis]MDV2682910.1 hypothetical protein [Alkalihalophilus lindianensis]
MEDIVGNDESAEKTVLRTIHMDEVLELINYQANTGYGYGYYSGMEDEFIDGYVQLFESPNGWYYHHKHADKEDYNGGVYTQRLRMFIDSIEWH